VAFGDAARAWGPGSAGAGWFVSAGVGLRLALPQWSPNQVLRFDLAWPVHPGVSGDRKPVLSFGSSQAF
jgi:outer membrane protein assembly factor BamA